MFKRKRIKLLIKRLDTLCFALRELASFKEDKFDGSLWLSIHSEVCNIAEELEVMFKCKR